MSLTDLFFVVIVLLTVMFAANAIARLVLSWARSWDGEIPEPDRELIELQDRRRHLLDDLHDLELDAGMAKISEEEYLRQRRRLEPEAVRVLRDLERRGATLASSENDEAMEHDDEG